jgi:glycosyltransferase involved in cell wall biosynthesis
MMDAAHKLSADARAGEAPADGPGMEAKRELGPDRIIAELQAKLGRPLRVLHIGNIANNAYNNARIQRRFGIHSDVICYDYYHVMSCPEWEDGSFTGTAEGNFPDWFATSLAGWSRPDWFVQGPVDLCLQYLRARQLNMRLTSRLMKAYLEVNYWRILDDFAALEGRVRPRMPRHMRWTSWLVEALGLHRPIDPDRDRLNALLAEDRRPEPKDREGASLTERAETNGPLAEDRRPEPREGASSTRRVETSGLLRRGRAHIEQTTINLRIRLFHALVMKPLSEERFDAIGVRMWLALRHFRGNSVEQPSVLAGLLEKQLLNGERESKKVFEERLRSKKILQITVLRRRFQAFPKFLQIGFQSIYEITIWIRAFINNIAKDLLEFIGKAPRRRMASLVGGVELHSRFKIFSCRRRQFVEENKDREFSCNLQNYIDFLPLKFFDIIKQYDIVQGYSTDGFIPFMNGFARFAAYEHGTIRDLPWEPSVSGVVCSRVYREAPLVFVTNSDVMTSVDRLGLPPERVVYLPHAFDDSKLRAFRDAHPDLSPPKGPPVFFSPTRHHWKDKSGSWTKGNDVFLRAAGQLSAEGYDFRLVLVEWGKEVPESRELIDSLGLASKVSWVPTMQKRELWAEYCRAHAVIDQFALPALGGVGFETMALGRRLVTALDEEQLTEFFGCCPPCLIAESVGACTDRLREVLLDPEDLAERGAAARQWMMQFHSAERIVSLQAGAYRNLIAAFPDPMTASC